MMAVAAHGVLNQFVELFGETFNLSKNSDFVDAVNKAFQKKRWPRLVGLWQEAGRMAMQKFDDGSSANGVPKQKRRKLESVEVLYPRWQTFLSEVKAFDERHGRLARKGKASKFAFAFVEGPLVKALRQGDWVLLDEINLASPETLESLSTLLQTPTSSITLTDRGDLEPVERHPGFRLFACMNPATDVGKRDLPSALRARFSEFWVPSPDADREALVAIVQGYVGHAASGDKRAILDVAEFYATVKDLSVTGQLADGSNNPPHFSMRTLSRALVFAADMAPSFGLRRALFEGLVMTFTMLLDSKSAETVNALIERHILAPTNNPRAVMAQIPPPPSGVDRSSVIQLGAFWLKKGLYPTETPTDYVLTPSVQTKIVDLARVIVTGRFPILIEGPTSAGKTSIIEYLARLTGHRFIRINNHEHTDIQEYLGTYVSDPRTGKLVFQEGILVRALRNGDWLVLDELNLAPTDVLEALNRLLDDNRELVVPETQEVVRPHPDFMLFATQNPSGQYGGRKALSRAFRNRFLELHFSDVPQGELETILCERCKIAPSYAKKIVAVFVELQRRRQVGRVFEQRHAFATLRDLFRWGGRGAVGYQQLAEDGYMLLAERTRRPDDKVVVKDVIEKVMKVTIDEKSLYNFDNGSPTTTYPFVWTRSMRRLYSLVSAAISHKEPVLLVGETGCGKTAVCQAVSEALKRPLFTLNCHQNTETSDILGGQRPVRNRLARTEALCAEAAAALQSAGFSDFTHTKDPDAIAHALEKHADSHPEFVDLAHRLHGTTALFEWYDGPLVQAMSRGALFLLDEISLADDSVLERLNSVLEPGRTLVLAEKSSADLDDVRIVASDSFHLLATMNPGGDYGKKELSPALRNRFTEIWVPAFDDQTDVLEILEAQWSDASLSPIGPKMAEFGDWLTSTLRTNAQETLVTVGLRDMLAWAAFINSYNHDPIQAFLHGAFMTVVDGLGTHPATAGLSVNALEKLRAACLEKLSSLCGGVGPSFNHDIHDTRASFGIGPFEIAKAHFSTPGLSYSLDAPTTRDNAMRVMRALQLSKPILLEGSPGVGKTSLVTALSTLCSRRLCRINLSDQTDLMDLFGSDLPVEGGKSGEFEWKDAPFLSAMKNGDWVLLDEMNLASQSVLEGLNSCLDHRGEVYVPELDRSFVRHPEFRIFAAQNPLSQGGARKGLPKSFLDRFSKVYMSDLTPHDYLVAASAVHPSFPSDQLNQTIQFTSKLASLTTNGFAREGAPWEFNLRDVLRWVDLVESLPGGSPADFADILFTRRFRTEADRKTVAGVFKDVFGVELETSPRPAFVLTASQLQIGLSSRTRQHDPSLSIPLRLPRLPSSYLPALESLSKCIEMGWLSIITGGQGTGKSNVVRQLASYSGRKLREFSMSNQTDTLELLGGFEQSSETRGLLRLVDEIEQLFQCALVSALGDSTTFDFSTVTRMRESANFLIGSDDPRSQFENVASSARDVLDYLSTVSVAEYATKAQIVKQALASTVENRDVAARFEWVDGVLVDAMRRGEWLLIKHANLCSASVLDRLNSLFEPGGNLVLAERGLVDGELQVINAHPDFRLVLALDPRLGELSRAMRNRGIEINLDACPVDHADLRRLWAATRLDIPAPSPHEISRQLVARGIVRPPFLAPFQGLSTVGQLVQDPECYRISRDALAARLTGPFSPPKTVLVSAVQRHVASLPESQLSLGRRLLVSSAVSASLATPLRRLYRHDSLRLATSIKSNLAGKLRRSPAIAEAQVRFRFVTFNMWNGTEPVTFFP
jgi:midasin